MDDKKLMKLLKKHTEVQTEANSLYSSIISELDKRGLLSKYDVLSCLNNTEPSVWEEIIIKLIKR